MKLDELVNEEAFEIDLYINDKPFDYIKYLHEKYSKVKTPTELNKLYDRNLDVYNYFVKNDLVEAKYHSLRNITHYIISKFLLKDVYIKW